MLFFSLALTPAFAKDSQTNSLIWHKDTDTMDADIRSWDVLHLLRNLAGATGWKVYLDPGAIHGIDVKFKGKPTGEALHTMFGNLNFILVPETNSASRLYVFRTSQRQATRLVAPPKEPAKPIPNQLVVRLKPGSKTKIEDLAKFLNAKIIGRMDKENAYLLQFQDDNSTQHAEQQLASNPDVAGTEFNYPIDAPPSMTAVNGNAPGFQLNPSATGNSKQIVVGLIDTPVQTLPGNLNSFLEPALHEAGDYSVPSDQILHGTGMAETILQSLSSTTQGSSSVQILPVDVYGNNESTSTFYVAEGISDAINHGANILNLSLGSSADSQILHDTINDALSHNIVMFAAAGNDPVDTPTYPAAYQGVNPVTAIDPNTGQLASYANRYSYPGSTEFAITGDNLVPFDGQTWMIEGTSTSTAFATGTAAGLVDRNNALASEAVALFQKSISSSARR